MVTKDMVTYSENIPALQLQDDPTLLSPCQKLNYLGVVGLRSMLEITNFLGEDAPRPSTIVLSIALSRGTSGEWHPRDTTSLALTTSLSTLGL